MELVIRKGTADDLESFIDLLQKVHQAMPNKDWFYLDESDVFRQMMADGVMEFWCAMDGAQLVAAFSILIPGLEAYNYGYDLGFDEYALMQAVNMDTVAVHPAYRGRGLHKRLLQEAELAAVCRGAKYLLCTVHPDNVFSLNNFLAQGYTIVRQLPKYGSVRCLLRKDI